MSRFFIVHVYTKNKALINLINLIEQSFCYEKSLKEEYLTFPKPVGTFLDSKLHHIIFESRQLLSQWIGIQAR